MTMRRTCNLSVFLLIVFLIVPLSTAFAQGTDVIRNGDFTNGLNEWIVNPKIDPAWDPLEGGQLSLDPPMAGMDPYRGMLIYQNLNVANIQGKNANFSMTLSQTYSADGRSVYAELVYVNNDNSIGILDLDIPPNHEISGNPAEPTHLSLQVEFPADARKLVKIQIKKKNWGGFVAGNISLFMEGVAVGPLPVVTALSARSGEYGSQLTITGLNFGASQGFVSMGGTSAGVQVDAWSDTSVTVTIQDPARSGRVYVISDYVESNIDHGFYITSPNFTFDILNDEQIGVKGQGVEYVIRVDFFNDFEATGEGVVFALDPGTLPANASHYFTPNGLKKSGGALLKLDTTGVAAGEYPIMVTAQAPGVESRSAFVLLEVVTIETVRFFEYVYDDVTDTTTKEDVPLVRLSSQGTFNVSYPADFHIEAVDSKGAIWDLWGGYGYWGNSPIILSSTDPSVVQVYQTEFGPEYYALDEGTASLVATTADGTSASLPVSVDIPADDPRITSISVSPAQIDHNYTDDINFSATATHPITWVGTWSHGTVDFRSTFLNNPSYGPENKSVTSTFQLGNQDGDQEPGIFTAFLHVTASGAMAFATLDVGPDPAMGQLKGGVRTLDDMFAEFFLFQFYDAATGNKVHEREVGLYHKVDFHLPGIPSGAYKLKVVYWDMDTGQEIGIWYPNAETIEDAAPLSFLEGAVVEDVYIFLTTPKLRGAVIYNGPQAGPMRVAVKAAWDMDDDQDVAPVETNADGTFAFMGLPAGDYYVYAYVDVNQDQQYTSGEAYGYYHGSGQHLTPVTVGGGTTDILIFLEEWTGNTGISGTIASNLGSGVNGEVILFPPGLLPIAVEPDDLEFPEELSGVEVHLSPGLNPYQMLNFDFGNGPPLPAGAYDMLFVTGMLDGRFETIVVQGFQQGVQVTKGSVTPNINFTLNPGATLSGTVLSDAANPFPVVDAEVIFFSFTGTPQDPLLTLAASGEADYEGNYRFENLAPGSYFLVVSAEGFDELDPILVTISDVGQILTEIVVLQSSSGYAQISVTVRDTLGDPIEGDQRVYLLKDGDEEPFAFLAEQGSGAFSSYVLAGTYTVVASARGFKPWTQWLRLQAADEEAYQAYLSGPESAVGYGVDWLLAQQNPDGSFGPPHQFIFGWSGYAALALLSVKDNPNLSLEQDLLDRIENAMDDEEGSDGKVGVKQYFLSTFRSEDDPGTPWNDTGVFADDLVLGLPVAATPVALERLIALGLPIDDPKVAASVQFLKNAQVTPERAREAIFEGGWRYTPDDRDGDNWETPWVVMALMKAGLSPTEPHVAAGVDFMRRSQITEGENAGMFKYMPDQPDWYMWGATSACMVALNFAQAPRNDPAVDLFFEWARNNPEKIHAWERGSNAYHWAMLSWTSSLYEDPDNPGKTEYETLDLTWNLADYIYLQQSWWDGSWSNPAPSQTGSRSANAIMFTSSAIMALAPYPAPLAPPEKKTVSGTVYGHTDQELESALVEAVLAGNAVDSLVTDETGDYALQVPVGYAYTIRVTAAGYARKSIDTGMITDDLAGQDISFEAGDIDNALPTISVLTPADGSTVTTAGFEISAILTDDNSGIDPASIVLTLNGHPLAATYDEGTGRVSYLVPPHSDLENRQHFLSLDVMDYAKNAAVTAEWYFTLDRWMGVPGDLNNDGNVDLQDLILGLKVLAGKTQDARMEGDVNGDGRIGMVDVIYILQSAAGLR